MGSKQVLMGSGGGKGALPYAYQSVNVEIPNYGMALSTPTAVQAGYYSTGGNETTRTGEAQCSPGYYCDEGVRFACPAGRYGSITTWGLTSANCSGECSTGYFCPQGSTSPRQEPCGIGAFPARYYCPPSTDERLVVSDGYYSSPESNSEEHRESQLPCPQQYDCVNGTR